MRRQNDLMGPARVNGRGDRPRLRERALDTGIVMHGVRDCDRIVQIIARKLIDERDDLS